MISPKAMEAWFNLMAEAMRGSGESQAAFKALAEAMTSPEAMQRWLARFTPAAAATTNPAAFEEWQEEWWRAMGVVPRSRYLELLERYELLRSRLEKAEETIKQLQTSLGGTTEQKAEAQKALELWEKMLAESLKTQTEWLRAWATQQAPAEEPDPDRPDQTNAETPPG